jgi:pimeloyl-ACP methyl ester carboxylesterase/DNA-binding CsgD family transcriptional regulator
MPKAGQHIRFCKSRDGTQIATASLGHGPPLVRAAHWMSHVEYDARSPVWMDWLDELSRDNTLIRYDQRGCGLSDWSTPLVSLDAWVEDLEAVVAAYGLKRFPLFGMSQGAAIAIAYAARHPEKVSRLVLLGALTRGMLRRELPPEQRDEPETLLNLIRLGWGRDNPASRQFFTSQFMPDGTREQHRWFNELERMSASPENAAAIVEMLYQVDVSDDARRLAVPTVVMHVRDDARIPFEESRRLAGLIPGARFVPLDGRNHVLIKGEAAWPRFFDALRAFLAEDRDAGGGLRDRGLTDSELAVLSLIARGMDNVAIADALSKSEKTVRNQVSSIFAKLDVKTRAQAIVLARESGLGGV